MNKEPDSIKKDIKDNIIAMFEIMNENADRGTPTVEILTEVEQIMTEVIQKATDEIEWAW